MKHIVNLLIISLILVSCKENDIENPKNDNLPVDSLSHWVVYDSIPVNATDFDFDSNNNLWLTTSNGLLYKMNGEIFVTKYKNEGLDFSPIRIDINDNIWIGTNSDDIICYFNGYRKTITHKPFGQHLSRILTIEFENDSIVWFGTANYGLIKLSDNKLSYLSNELGNGCVFDIYVRNKIKYFGTSQGLLKYSNNQFSHISLIQNTVFNDTIWKADNDNDYRNQIRKILTYGDSLLIISLDGIYLYKDSLDYQEIFKENKYELTREVKYDACVDKNGTIWIGTSNGLVKLEKNGTYYNYNQYNSKIEDGDISIVKIDKEGNLWILDKHILIKIKI